MSHPIEPSRRRLRLSLRRSMVLVALAALVFAYVGGCYRLSRRSLRDNAQYGLDGILDVPMVECFPTNPRDPGRGRAIQRHDALVVFFAPVHWLDRLLFGTPPPASCFLTLSG